MVASRLGGAMSRRSPMLHPGTVLAVAVLACLGYCIGAGGCALLSPDRQGYRSFSHADFGAAAGQFADPQWRAAALFRGGDFEQAAGIWSGSDTAEGAFNHGNALVMQGEYAQAAQRYARALELRPGWTAAQENREIALSRARALEQEGGDMTGGMLGADEIVFSSPPAKADPGTDQSEPEAAAGDAARREIWLRQVQTRPADFLRSKFAYQYATRAAEETD
jgi:Ca-activated chloride channel family protein